MLTVGRFENQIAKHYLISQNRLRSPMTEGGEPKF